MKIPSRFNLELEPIKSKSGVIVSYLTTIPIFDSDSPPLRYLLKETFPNMSECCGILATASAILTQHIFSSSTMDNTLQRLIEELVITEHHGRLSSIIHTVASSAVASREQITPDVSLNAPFHDWEIVNVLKTCSTPILFIRPSKYALRHWTDSRIELDRYIADKPFGGHLDSRGRITFNTGDSPFVVEMAGTLMPITDLTRELAYNARSVVLDLGGHYVGGAFLPTIPPTLALYGDPEITRHPLARIVARCVGSDR
eukprot:gnl/Dysnectes_brevis/3589_a4564_554.p1 GENE.gnl/Dysnectes_brevis/3589_a4564_554~~gnl/Dysnectes_brevis/3589_a4564_554.p1  ORF type:complete len:257 (+),score=21.37 gnl/Dysnectes_brevis/3589_a4564_554:634-1404(+)